VTRAASAPKSPPPPRRPPPPSTRRRRRLAGISRFRRPFAFCCAIREKRVAVRRESAARRRLTGRRWGGGEERRAERPIKTESARAPDARGGVAGAGPIAVQFVMAGARGAQWRPGARRRRVSSSYSSRPPYRLRTLLLTSTGLECQGPPAW